MSFEPASLQTALLSDVGRARSENQDACGEFRSGGGARLLIVADGMGGHRGGDTASRLALEVLGTAMSNAAAPDGSLLERAIEDANARVRSESEANLELRGMGTTCVALLFAPGNAAWVAHVGDSRAYRWRRGSLEALTRDHSLVGELVRRGEITPEEAEVHPRRNEILRSIGITSAVEVELRPIDVLPGDRYLLCSDGLSGVVSEHEISAVLAAEPPDRAAQILVDAANARGGPDNVTVAIGVIPETAAASYAAPGRPPEPSPEDLRRFELELSQAAAQQRFRGIAIAVSIVAALLAACLLLLVGLAQRTQSPVVASPPATDTDAEPPVAERPPPIGEPAAE
jgi:protein phosphatase